MDEAISRGIIDAESGVYHNLMTGDTYPIPIAMTAGLIVVESTQTKKTKEKTQGVGVVTVKVSIKVKVMLQPKGKQKGMAM